MVNRGKVLFSVIYLTAFLGLTLGIHFFHTEGSGSGNECPACHFLSSSLSVAPVHFSFLPPVIFRRIPKTAEPVRLHEGIVLSLSARSPPQA
jgi:hypothetical protein